MDRLQLILAGTDGYRRERSACSVILPASDGLLGILPGHAPMLCALRAGEIVCRSETGESERFAVSGGVAHVADNRVTVLLYAAGGERETED